MRSAISLLILALTFSSAFATELASRYVRPQQKFFAYANWVPTSVDPEWTPGSDCNYQIVTNVHFSEWKRDASRSYDDTSGCIERYGGALPIWNGTSWSTYNAFFYSTGAGPGAYVSKWGDDPSDIGDENATELDRYYFHVYIIEEETGRTLTEAASWAVFTRDRYEEVITNTIPTRLTPDLHASFARTLDGWCEREYFGGLALPEPSHELTTTAMDVLDIERSVETRRLTGATNMWLVADKLVDISENDWRGGTVSATNYTYKVGPYWSSQTFDDIYGDQMPNAIAWNRYGLDELTNKCAVLRGVVATDIWGGSGTNGWMFEEMCPVDFAFGLTNEYHCGEATPGHKFTFPDLVASNHICAVDGVTDQTRRLNTACWGAVNQAMSEMDRTFNPVGSVPAETGARITYTQVRRFSTSSYKFDDLGITYANHEWSLGEDFDEFTFTESTNYLTVVTNAWVPQAINSDTIELTSNKVNIALLAGPSYGYLINAGSIAAELTQRHAVGTPGVSYPVIVTSVSAPSDVVYVHYSCANESFVSEFPYAPSNATMSAVVVVENSYDYDSASAPSFTNLCFMPMYQAWEAGAGGRVESCKDVCTASIGIIEHDRWRAYTNAMMHCNVITRRRQDDLATIHKNEWNLHRTEMANYIYQRCGIDWSDMGGYVNFWYWNVSEVLDSVTLKKGSYPFTWTATSLETLLQVDENGVWFVEDGSGIAVGHDGLAFEWEIDKPAHSITKRYPIEGHCRQRIMNIVNWDWNSVHKSAQ